MDSIVITALVSRLFRLLCSNVALCFSRHGTFLIGYLLASSQFFDRVGQLDFLAERSVATRSRHSILTFIGVRGHSHTLLVRGVESLLGKCNIFGALVLYLLQLAVLSVNLGLNLLHNASQLVHFVHLGGNKHFKLLPLDINVGSLLFGLFLHASACLHHSNQFLEILSRQLLSAFSFLIKLAPVLLDLSVVLSDNF